ncbi:MAG TPA: hypothetical protein V6D19_21780 [Stenomitos sp.]
MSERPEYIRQSTLLHQPVANRGATRTFGTVESVWMHPPAHRVLGFICAADAIGEKKWAFNLAQVDDFEETEVIVKSPPAETNAGQVRFLETLLGRELWSDAGNRLGVLSDYIFQRDNGSIHEYLFRPDGLRGWTGSLMRLPSERIVRFGRTRVWIAAQDVSTLLPDEAGLEYKVSQAVQDVRSLPVQAMAQQAKDQWQTLQQKAAQQVQTIAAQATDRAKSLADPLITEGAEPTQRLVQEGRSLWRNVRSRLQDLSADLTAEPDSPPKQQQQDKRSQPRQPPSAASDPEIDWHQIPPEDLDDDTPWI